MSRAVVFDEFGGPEVLRVREIADPPAHAGELAVRVEAVGLNPWDAKARTGFIPVVSSFPWRAGAEFTGVVTEVGDDAEYYDGTPARIGDAVIGWKSDGTLGERLTVPVGQVVRRPAAVPIEVAGSLTIAGLTALASLRTSPVADGDTVLLGGAAGVVGIVYAQLALARGARVIGTASPAKHEFLRSIGVTPIAYGDGLVARAREAAESFGTPLTAVQDNHGREALDAGITLGIDPARICGIAGYGAIDELGVRTPGRFERRAAHLAEAVAEFAAGRVVLPIAATFTLDQAVSAFEALDAPHAVGKIVIVV